jgi:hypothetical protein
VEGQRSFAEELTQLAKRQRTLYDRHVMHIDFSAFGLPQPVYINLLRDPIRMQVSAFYFWRECMCAEGASRSRASRPRASRSRASPRFCTIARRGLPTGAATAWSSAVTLCRSTFTIDELYANLTPKPRIGTMTRWFCGPSTSCSAADGQPSSVREREAALRRAVYTMRERYIWAGVVERMEDSLRLLAHMLPAMFGSLVVSRDAHEHVRPRTSSPSYTYPEPARATVLKLSAEEDTDVRLYEQAVGLLNARLRSCGLFAERHLASDKFAHPLPDHLSSRVVALENNAAARLLQRTELVPFRERP